MDKYDIEKLLKYNLKVNGVSIGNKELGPIVISILHTVIDVMEENMIKLKQEILDEIKSSSMTIKHLDSTNLMKG